MRKLGRRLGEDERDTKIRLLNLLPEEPPGSRFNELVQAARSIGVSKPTLWRYLVRFEKLGLVTHEGKFYRRNPLHGFVPKSMATKISMKLIATVGPRRWEFALGPDWHGHDTYDLPSLSKDRPIDPWSIRNARARPELKDAEKFYGWFGFHVSAALSGYLTLLGVLCEAENLATAREVANILMDLEVVRPLRGFARDVWDHRSELPLKALKGRELNFRVAEGLPSSEERDDSR